jgi:hypothetical protein
MKEQNKTALSRLRLGSRMTESAVYGALGFPVEWKSALKNQLE